MVEVFWASKTNSAEWYLITEFIHGDRLDAFIGHGRSLRDREAVDVALDLLDALVAFHPDSVRLGELDAKRRQGDLSESEFHDWMELGEHGLVHRDIKPRNVILTLRWPPRRTVTWQPAPPPDQSPRTAAPPEPDHNTARPFGIKKILFSRTIVVLPSLNLIPPLGLHCQIPRIHPAPGWLQARGQAECRLVVQPVALGEGLALFAGLTAPFVLDLIEAQPYAGGAVLHIYRPAAR